MAWHGRPQTKAFYAQGRLKPGQMNKGEAAYAAHLDREKAAGRILWWRFQGLKFRLADNTFYTPDFNVLPIDRIFEIHECKGNWQQDDARAKIKIAADLYPFRFMIVKPLPKRDGGGWEVEDFSRSDEDEQVPAAATQPALQLETRQHELQADPF